MNVLDEIRHNVIKGLQDFGDVAGGAVAGVARAVQSVQRATPRAPDLLVVAASVAEARLRSLQLPKPGSSEGRRRGGDLVGQAPAPQLDSWLEVGPHTTLMPASVSLSFPFRHQQQERRRRTEIAALAENSGAAAAGGAPAGGAAGSGAAAGAPGADSAAAGPGRDAGGAAGAAERRSVAEERVLISEVDVQGVNEELRKLAFSELQTKPNFSYSEQDIKSDLARLVDVGFFQSGYIKTDDTRDGVKLTFVLIPWTDVKTVKIYGATALPEDYGDNLFKEMYGKPLNTKELTKGLLKIKEWYIQRGYIADVVDVDQDRQGVVDVRVAEAVVNRINLRFNKPNGESAPRGKTRPEVILRHLDTKPGQLYNERTAARDIEKVNGMGLYDEVDIVPQLADTSIMGKPKVDLTLNVTERKTGGLSMGGGISASGYGAEAPGLVGHVSYSERNLFGLNQRLTLSAEVGQAETLYRIHHLDPWVGAHRTSRSITVMNTKNSLGAIHGAANDAQGVDGAGEVASDASTSYTAGPAGGQRGELFMGRELGSVEWTRPLANGWSGTWGATIQRTRVLDDANVAQVQDHYNAPLLFSRGNSDWGFVASGRMVYSGAEGEAAALSVEKAVPLPPIQPTFQSLNFFRVRARGEGRLKLGKVALVGAARGGSVLGDLPPYEAFPIGGTNSVRGYSEGAVGTGRHYVVLTGEAHYPLMQSVTGTAFADYGTDLRSGESVIGDPAGLRNKPGSGFGVGLGLRLDSPVGPLRLEYAWNHQGRGRFHFGIGGNLTS